MNRLRSLTFDLLFYSFTVLICFIALPLVFAPRCAILWLYPLQARVTAWLLAKIVGIHMRIEGNVPKGPVIIASKHQSTWETILFGCLVEDPAMVLKRELMWLPILGPIMRRQEMIPVSRQGGKKSIQKMLTAAKRAIADGRPIVIFPEGTRQAPGKKGRYYAGVTLLYNNLNVPVVPVALNAGYFWGRRQPFKKAGLITIRFLPPITPGLPKETFLKTLEEQIETACQEIAPQANN